LTATSSASTLAAHQERQALLLLDYEGFRQKLTPSVVLTVPTENELGVGLPGPELTIR